MYIKPEILAQVSKRIFQHNREGGGTILIAPGGSLLPPSPRSKLHMPERSRASHRSPLDSRFGLGRRIVVGWPMNRKTDQIRAAWAAGDQIRALRITPKCYKALTRSNLVGPTSWSLLRERCQTQFNSRVGSLFNIPFESLGGIFFMRRYAAINDV